MEKVSLCQKIVSKYCELVNYVILIVAVRFLPRDAYA